MAAGTAHERFGRSIALAGDGNTAIVGAPGAGFAWVLERSAGTWHLQHPALTGIGESGDGTFGRSVTLSAGGDTALVGDPGDAGHAGAVWAFTRGEGGWEQQGSKLTAGPEESGQGHYGSSVSISSDGNTALVGARADSSGKGAAWVLTRSGASWSQLGPKLVGAGESGAGKFGQSVSLSGDGSTGLIGAPVDGGRFGAAWSFTRSGSAFVAAGGRQREPAENGHGVFGESTALSGDGVSGLIGAPYDAAGTGVVLAYPAPPAVTKITPTGGPALGGTAVTINGSGFLPGATVTIGSAATTVDVLSETELTAVTSASAPGPAEVVVSDSKGTSSGGPTFTYAPPPTVTEVSPTEGPSKGGTVVTITGTGFVSGAHVTIGSAAKSVNVVSSTEITAVTSATAPGSDEVVVSEVNGTSSGGPSYTYLPPPHVSEVSPAEGPSAGGTPVTIKGSGFLAGATVTIGSAATSVHVVSGTEITAVTSATAPGASEVVVSDAKGTSSGGPSYTYLPPPHVSEVSPAEGPSAGGTPVTIKGSGFLAGATVTIGSAATSVHVVSGTEITAVTSATAPGADEVVVADTNGTSSAGPSFTYVAPPEPPPSKGTGGEGGLSLITPPPGGGVLFSQSVGPPTLDVTGNIAPVSGVVLIKLPGSGGFVPLNGLRQVPFGVIVDASHGTVAVTTEDGKGNSQTMTYYEGQFALTQNHEGLVVAKLSGGTFKGCPRPRKHRHKAHASNAHAARRRVVRKLWASGHGTYSTRGNYAAGAVLGTRWLTEDLCGATLIRVFTDKVSVTNLVNHHHVTVKAGHSYLATAP